MIKVLGNDSKKGFTLPEILIVVIIIGILIAIEIPIYSDVADNSRKTVCKYNASYIVRVLAMNLYNYEPEERYAANEGQDSLNNFLDRKLETTQEDSNKDRIMNPVSRSRAVLHNELPGAGSDPAVFITGNNSYSYSGSDTDNLRGTIVVYFNESDPHNIQIYYIDKENNKVEMVSEFH